MLKSRATGVLLLLVAAFGWQVGTAAAKPVLHWSQPEFLPVGPDASFQGANDISCADSNLCVAVADEGRFLYSADPTGGIEAWAETQVNDLEPADVTAVSCPTDEFCVAVDTDGNALISTNPANGAWIEVAVGDGDPLTDVSCASPTLCLLGDGSGDVFFSEDPEEASSWEATELQDEGEIASISCASAALCVVVADEETYVSTDPAAAAWSATGLSGFRAVSCPSDSFCAASSFTGVFVSGDPAAGAEAWTESPGSSDAGGHVSCPSEELCATLDVLARVVTSSDPGGASPGWKEAPLLPRDAAAVALSCPSLDFCAIALESGAVLTSTEPDGGPDAWELTDTAGGNDALPSADCPSASLCLVAGSRGMLYTSTEPTVPGSWTGTRITDGRIDQVECKEVNWCTVQVYNRTLLYSTDPTGGPEAWSSVSIPFALDIACPEDFFCAAVDGSDQVLLSHEPLTGAESWEAVDLELPDWRLGPNQLQQVSCPWWGLCAVGGDVGMVATSSNPLAGKAAWFPDFVGDPDDFYNGAGPNIGALDCPSAFFCAATMWSGTISTTQDPANPPVPWTYENTEENFYTSISCSYGGGLCVAAGREGSVVSALDGTSADPTWGAPEPLAHEGLEDVACAPEDAFCLVVDAQGYATFGRIGDDGSVDSQVVGETPPVTVPDPRPPRRCKVKQSKGAKVGKLAIGGAIPLNNGGRRSKSRCSRPA
jgi:hypothetical protein